MPTTMAALMQSPGDSSGSTIHAGGKTLPDITLGSLGSSFRSDEDEDAPNGKGENKPHPLSRVMGPPQRMTESSSSTYATPSPQAAPSSALFALSPPTTARKVQSNETPGSQAPRRNRILRKGSTASSASSSDAESALAARYGASDSESEDPTSVLASLSINVSPPTKGKKYGATSKRSGRHSVAADVGGPMTLREQEQELDAVKKDNFNLQLENHFLKERLANMAPDHIEAALKENVKLKLEILNISKEMKKLKKLLLQQDRDLAEAARNADGTSKGKSELRELERMYKEEKERRKGLEAQLAGRGDRTGGEDTSKLKAALEDTEASERVWRDRCEALEVELENAKADLEDRGEEMDKLRDEADRALDELERVQAGDTSRGLGGSIGMGKGREERLQQRLTALEQADLIAAKKNVQSAEPEDLKDRLNELQDKLAAAQLDLDKRDAEIEELNNELDAKVRDYEKEIGEVEAGWRDEVLDARAQVDELKDALETREQDLKDVRESLLDKDEELAMATAKVAEFQAIQNETHDRLEETMQNIERDNAEKDADLIAANREVEELGQRIYELEEVIDEYKAREGDLQADLKSADEAFENSKTHYENLVLALKEARKKLQGELEELASKHSDLQSARRADAERSRKDGENHARLLADKEMQYARLQKELDSARDRVTLRDQDLARVQSALRGLEDERQKVGDDHTSHTVGLELEMERVRRDLEQCEEELEAAKADLQAKDVEYAQMLEKQRELQETLSAERQARLNMSEKLDDAAKDVKKREREATLLRERIEELEPLLTETQQERYQLQKQSQQQQQEKSELLLRVFKDVNKFLGVDDHATPANFAVFKDTLVTRLRSMNSARSDFEKRMKDSEAAMEQKMNSLKRQLEQKWRALDNFEAAVKKLELTRMQWRTKYSIKDGELEAAKARNAELQHQLSSSKAGASVEGGTQLRSLTERASAAEKRAQTASNQLAQLEARLAEVQGKAGQAENKWEARVKEYENRLRIAGEKIKTEKQGGKERASSLEAQVRDLQRQLEESQRRNARAEGIVATASHLLPSDRNR